jgi:glycosyltransferase involved in cell wall biosynthesis
MPTANRRAYVPLSISTFLAQDYKPRELIIIDDGSESIADLIPADPRIRYLRVPGGRSLGHKRNQACGYARGEILVHWDDDDWSAAWRLSYQVAELQEKNADICGLDRLWFYDPDRNLSWRYQYPRGRTPWVAGTTLCFRRHLWERHAFPDITVGEDTLWMWLTVGARVLPLAQSDFLVARVHAGNTSPKPTESTWWTPCNPARVRALLGRDWDAFRGRSSPSPPLVSCILPTAGRRSFSILAVERFFAQDYPRKELIVVDDGNEPIWDVVGALPSVRYLRAPERSNVGAKRNLGCIVATGEIFVQWDDDDWYGPDRLSQQVAPLADGRADISALEMRWIVKVPEGEFWTVSPGVHRRMFYCDVHGGTLAFTRAVWASGTRYPESSLPESVGFLRNAFNQGARLLRVANDELFVYVRHSANTRAFPIGRFIESHGWGRTQGPAAFEPDLLSRYQDAAAGLV